MRRCAETVSTSRGVWQHPGTDPPRGTHDEVRSAHDRFYRTEVFREDLGSSANKRRPTGLRNRIRTGDHVRLDGHTGVVEVIG